MKRNKQNSNNGPEMDNCMFQDGELWTVWAISLVFIFVNKSVRIVVIIVSICLVRPI